MSGISSVGGVGPGVIQSATTMINRAQAGATRDAATVASSAMGDGGADILGALVDARQQALYTQAGAKMISAANEMMGSLLDIRA